MESNKDKKSIMFIDKNKIVGYSGGVEKVICSFANDFLNRGYDVSIVCIDTEKGMPQFPLDNRARFINLCFEYSDKAYNSLEYILKKAEREILRAFLGKKLIFLGKSLDDPREAYFYREFSQRLEKCIEHINPDIIFPTDVESTFVVQKVLDKLRMNDIPVISMCHLDPGFFAYTDDYKSALRKATAVQVLLPCFKKAFEEMGVENIKVIPNMVSQIADENLRDLNECHYKIINVGRVDGDQKCQHRLIEAFSRIADKYPEWTVHFYGDIANKRYKHHLDSMISEAKLEDRIIFEGTTKEMQKKLLDADIFAFPSKYEGFSLALLEAMTAGLPVMAYKDCASVAAVIKNGETGFLAEAGIDDFACKLEQLIASAELRNSMGKAAHEEAKKYRPKAVWDMWDEYIKGFIGD